MDDVEFFAAATEIINDLENELRRVRLEERGRWRALEIGCGSGRLMRALSRHFVEIEGVDASAARIAEAKVNLRDLPNAQVRDAENAALASFEDASFDFLYTLNARPAGLDEIRRVMRDGGLARLRFERPLQTRAELLEFVQARDFQVLGFEGFAAQAFWMTMRKRPAGWAAKLDSQKEELGDALPVVIRRITNAANTEPLAPSRGRFASIAIRLENLPPDAGLSELRVTIGSSFGTVTRIGSRDRAGWQEIRVDLPELEATGLLPVQIFWLDHPMSSPAVLRVIPPGPALPRIVSVAKKVGTRAVKMVAEEIARPHEIEISVGGVPVEDIEFVCTDPRPQQFELSFRLPDEIGPGLHHLRVRVGRRKLAPMPIEVGA